MKIGTPVKATRRTGEVIRGKYAGRKGGTTGEWFKVKHDIPGVTNPLTVRPSQVKPA